MNTPSNAMPSRRSTAGSPPAPISATRPMYWSVRRELWENRSIYLAPLVVAARRSVRLPDQHDSSAGTMRARRARPGAAAAALVEQPYDAGGAADHGDRFHRRGLLLSRRAARRAPRSQHPVLEVAAGFRSHHRALEGEHPARGSAAAHLRDHRRHAVDHAAAQHVRPAGERPECRDAVDAVPFVPDVADAALPPSGRAWRSGMRRSTAGCCWSRPGRGARRFSGPRLPLLAIGVVEKIAFNTSHFAAMLQYRLTGGAEGAAVGAR